MSAVGILGLQGCIEPHVTMLRSIGVDAVRVRTAQHLTQVDRIILPGGESTTMLRLLAMNSLEAPLREFCRTHPTWGICAGSILLAKKVSHPEQHSLELIDLHAIRNFYGSQLDSFTTEVQFEGAKRLLQFIRAPKLEPLSADVHTLLTVNGSAVLLQQRNILVSAFHAELGNDPVFHRYFLSM